MSSCSTGSDHPNNRQVSCQSRGFFTPPANSFHVIHKVPSGNSPYVRAKHVQLIDKDPSKAIALFWAAINSGDRVDSALKDMAVVMRQLDRSDEAIEAIKSFRHLCPPESQDSLDNLLVDLYKLSGRIEEEIEILRLKVKQVEEGFAFGGKRVKLARSLGKKIQIPVEKYYSRLLGNLAWAYMQQKDFKSAEEHYRKALSISSNKNAQCNLAMCLMHMNKLTEAKFLLQAVRVSFNGHVEESHSKSYERASQMLAEFESKNSQMLAEFESKNALKCMKEGEYGNNVPYEMRAEFDRRRNHSQLNTGREAPDYARKRARDSPFTQPRQCSWSFNDEDKRDARSAGGHGGFFRKLTFGSSTGTENVNLQSGYRKYEKSWADVVEEEELGNRRSDFNYRVYSGFNDENVDSNVISGSPRSLNEVEEISQKIESIDLESGGYCTQPEKTKNQIVRRSLHFDQNQKLTGREKNHSSSPLPVEALDFEGKSLTGSDEFFSSVNCMNLTRRLQVFKDITHAEK